MDDQTSRDLDALTADAGRLDGHTIDELADYLDNDRTPVDDSIEGSPACRHALAALERLRVLAPDLLTDDGDEDGDDDAWMQAILSRIALDAHAGADFLIDESDDGDEAVMTEGALRALIRAAGDDEPGFLVGRIRFTGDLGGTGEPVNVAIDVIVTHGTAIPDGTARLRRSVLDQLPQHTRIQGPRVDITVRDLATGDA